MKLLNRGGIIFLAFVLMLTMVGAAYAASASPNLPQAFYGTISAADGGSINGGTVQATLGGQTFSLSFTGTTYGSAENLGERLLVWGVNPGDAITFTVNGVPATTTTTYVPGEVMSLNISIPRGFSSGGGGVIEKPDGRNASGTVQGNSETKLQDSSGTVELIIPAGAVTGSPDVEIKVSVQEILGSEVDDLIRDAKKPLGFKSIGNAFEVKVESDSQQETLTTFNKQITLSLKLSDKELEGVEVPEKLGYFKVNNDGTMTFVGGKYIEGQLTTPIQEPGEYILAEVNVEFDDMNGHWAQRDVEIMASKYVANGYPGGKFVPNGQVTRAEFACMLVKALQLPGTQGTASFQDVKGTDWFYKDLQAAVESGIVSGFPDGTFRPADLVSREEVASMVARALKTIGKAEELSAGELEGLLGSFGDHGKAAPWARGDLALAAKAGILKGTTTSNIKPKDSATRAESAVMLSRFWHK